MPLFYHKKKKKIIIMSINFRSLFELIRIQRQKFLNYSHIS